MFLRLGTILFLVLCTVFSALAQTPTPWPDIITTPTVYDFGNGPVKLRVIKGNVAIFTSQGGGTGRTSGSSTAVALVSTPTTIPCVGCVIAGTGIAAGTTVAAYVSTSITLSAAMTIAPNTALSWGATCPSAYTSPNYIQASASADYLPLYTQARICGLSFGGPSDFAITLPYTSTGGGSGDGGITVGASITGSCPDTYLIFSNAGVVGCKAGGGSGITALTGDVTASGSGSVAATLATTQPNAHTWTSPQTIGAGSAISSSGAGGTLASLSGTGQTLSGGFKIPALSLPSTSFTVDCSLRPLQYITNSTALTITAPADDSNCNMQITNNGTASTITLSGGVSVGDPFDTINGHSFLLNISRIGGSTTFITKARQ